jgi:hypothetical protein
MLIDGCHNGQFSATLQQAIDAGGIVYPRSHFLEWSPTDTSSWMLLEGGGGAIGVISTTGLGYGYINEHITAGLGGWLMPQFAHAYKEGNTHLGTMWGQAISDYIEQFNSEIYNDEIDRKTIEERVLFGDPSLKLGGYKLGQSSGDDNLIIASNNVDNVISASIANVPTWEVGQEWTYKIHDVELSFSEVEGRDFNIDLSAGDLNLKVADTSGDTYQLEFTANNLEALFDIYFDPYTGEDPKDILFEIDNVALTGNIYLQKIGLNLTKIEMTLDIIFDAEKLLEDFGITLPRIITKILFRQGTIPVTLDLTFNFDVPYTLLNFPLEVDKAWGMQGANITFDGTVQSRYLEILDWLNNRPILQLLGIELIPPELAKYLPVVDISEFLADQDINNTIRIPELKKMFRKPVFEVDRMENNLYAIEIVQGVGEIFYSPAVENVVRIRGNLHDFIPIVDNLEMELIS